MKKLLLAASLGMVALATAAHADPVANPWLLRAGVADIDMSGKVSLTVGGGPVSGAALSYPQIVTAVAEIGRYITPSLAVVATVGVPPHFGVFGAGSIAAYGKLENITFGPTALTLQYHPINTGVVQPYAGVGGSYMIIFSTSDAAIKNPKLTNDLAPALEIGSDFMLDQHRGAYVEVKKAWLQSTATGTIFGYPVNGKASLDPWVFSGGATFRF